MGTERGGDFPGDPIIYEGNPPGLAQKAKGAIEFYAEVVGVRTIKDGGIRLTLDLGEQARELMPHFARCQQNGNILNIEAAISE